MNVCVPTRARTRLCVCLSACLPVCLLFVCLFVFSWPWRTTLETNWPLHKVSLSTSAIRNLNLSESAFLKDYKSICTASVVSASSLQLGTPCFLGGHQ